jgi:hypothetical protein
VEVGVSDVKPALTATEWNRLEVEFGEEGWAHIEGMFAVDGESPPALVMPDMYVGTYDSEGTANGGVTMPPESRHRVAALALHGQPFGFTREDVEILRAIGISQLVGGRNTDINRIIRDRANGLADRIAALLPPSDSTRAQDE